MFDKDITEILQELKTQEEGLNDEEIKERIAKYGLNQLPTKKNDSWMKIFVKQFVSFMSIVLILAGVLSLIFGFVEEKEATTNFIEAGLIFAVLIINALIGTIQEYNASKTLEALKKIGAPVAKVYRNGKLLVVPSSDIVPGDIVFIDDGSIIPADIRLISSNNLQIQEASLTGESVPVKKNAKWVGKGEELLGDRINMCFSSTIVTYGNGIGVVCATGLKTEIGKIANLINNEKEVSTHIEKTMNRIGKILTIVGGIAAAIVLIFSYINNFVTTDSHNWMLPILLAVSLAVAVIPEGLPAMSTVLMSMGVRKMAKENAIVKKLPAVETLGSCTCICSDKTGTLTLNQMTVTKIFTPDEIISNKVDEPIEVKSENNEIYKELLKCGALCNTATLNQDNSTVGDPTEGALLLVCQQFKLSYETLRIEHPKLFELPFDSDRKRMSTIQKVFDNDVLFCKGATEEVLDICDYYQDANGQKQPMTEQIKNQIKDLNANLSAQALRILSFAKRELNDEVKDQNLENHLTYIGLMGMIDPPRKEVKAAVLKCRDAGIKVVMITGDHAITAKAIASELTIFQEGNEVMNGDELEKISEEELMKKVQKITVFSRISPSGKLKIINALKRSNEIVSMTGDGVNDAPSLKAADIGVAMGITGTDVAKASADVILLDDNFTTIGNAVFEGRRIFRNIQKVVQFLVSGCIAEVLVIIFATILSTFFGSSWDEILNPIQILMLNLVTDTIPCFAIGADKLTKNSKFKKPDVFREIFSKNVMFNIAITGAYFSLIALVGYVLGEVLLHETPHAGMTIAFLTLSLVQVFHTFNMQSNFVSIFSKENQFNKLVPILTGSSILVIAAFVVVGLVGGPVASQTLGIVSLPAWAWAVSIILPLSVIPFVELVKWLHRINTKKHNQLFAATK